MSITVTDDVPGGNVADVAVEDRGDVVRIEFAAHPHGGPEALWFRFRLCRTRPMSATSRIRLVLKHGQNLLGSGEPKVIRPVVREANCNWRRLDAGDVDRLGDGRFTVAWEVLAPAQYLDVAFCYPYGMAQLRKLLDDCDGFYNTDVIGVSQKGRQLVRLSSDYGDEGSDRPGIYLIARQHSGETPGSYVLDGILRYLAKAELKNGPLVWAVPLANIDGVQGGDYGKDNFPYDLNRAWGNPPMRHETLILQRDIRRFGDRCRPVAAVDLHAPGACETGGIYCFVPTSDECADQFLPAAKLAEAAGEAIGDEYAAEEFTRVATYASRWETPNFTTFCADALSAPALTFETPYSMIGDRVLTVEDYRWAGRKIAEGLLAELKRIQ